MKAVRFTALVGTALLLLFQWGSAAHAQAPIIVALDMDPTGNSCPGDGVNNCTLGPIDSCVSVVAGDSFTFDIVVDRLPHHYTGEGQAAFDTQLVWGPLVAPAEADVIDITARTAVSPTIHYLAQATGSTATLNDPQALPWTAPPYVGSVSDLGTEETNPPWTQGTAWRGTATVSAAAAPGIYKLEVVPGMVFVSNNIPYDECSPDMGGPGCTLQNAYFAVGMPCPEAPTATATPTPSPTPSPEPFTPTYSMTADDVSPGQPTPLPIDDECPVSAPCKILYAEDIPDGQPSGGFSVLAPAAITQFAGDAIVPDGAIIGHVSYTRRSTLQLGTCPSTGTIVSSEWDFLEGTTDPTTSTGSPSDVYSFTHWPAQLNGFRDMILAGNPGSVLHSRWVKPTTDVPSSVLVFKLADGSLLYLLAPIEDPTLPPAEDCGPLEIRYVAFGVTADNPATTQDEGGIPLVTCAAPGTQTYTLSIDRDDTPEWDPVVLGDTITCSPNTPAGGDVSVPLNGGTEALAGIDITFSSVTSGGTTTVITTTTGPPPPTGFEIVGLAEIPLYFDINTDAAYSGALTVCVRYDESQVQGPESALSLMQRVDDSYVDVTTSVDAVGDIICGTTTHLSIFIVAEPAPNPTPTPPPAVGGAVDLRPAEPAASARQSDSPAIPYAALAGIATAAALAFAAGAWHIRRRWVR